MSTEEKPSYPKFRTLECNIDLRKGKGYTLILIKPQGPCGFANTIQDKDILLSNYEPLVDTLLLAWVGQWRTDIFQLAESDLDVMYRIPTGKIKGVEQPSENWRVLKGRYAWLWV